MTATGLLALSACSGTSSEVTAAPTDSSPTTATSTPSSTITSVDLTQPIDHVHGLVATGSDQVVAGTHSGAVRVKEDGTVHPQGDQRDDLMGMTGKTDTDQLISSGHPGSDSQFPNPMGLVTSSDAGVTWTAVSLQGEVDFHALAMTGQNVVGYGGGATLMLSANGGKTWTDGAALNVTALAYSGNRLLATTGTGLQVSTDDGRTFNAVSQAPTLALVSAGKGAAVLGLDTSGVAWNSDNSGSTWTEVGRVGRVQAIASYDNTLGYAIDENRLVIIK